MKKNEHPLVVGAAVRAAILEVLHKTDHSMKSAEIRNSPEVKATGVTHGKFDSIVYLLHKAGKLKRVGQPGSFLYEPLGAHVITTPTPQLPKVIDRGHERQKPGHITARYNSKTGGIQLEFNGHFVLNFEKS